jgi:hypothetical protein
MVWDGREETIWVCCSSAATKGRGDTTFEDIKDHIHLATGSDLIFYGKGYGVDHISM